MRPWIWPLGLCSKPKYIFSYLLFAFMNSYLVNHLCALCAPFRINTQILENGFAHAFQLNIFKWLIWLLLSHGTVLHWFLRSVTVTLCHPTKNKRRPHWCHVSVKMHSFCMANSVQIVSGEHCIHSRFHFHFQLIVIFSNGTPTHWWTPFVVCRSLSLILCEILIKNEEKNR